MTTAIESAANPDGKKRAGRLLDGAEYSERPPFTHLVRDAT